MRFKGLVRIFNNVRSQLRSGLKPDEVDPFRNKVKAIVSEVEETCLKHGVTPAQLPAPSRMAYVFLKELDLDSLPVVQDDDTTGATSALKFKGVVKIGDYFAEKLWQQLDLLLLSPNERTKIERDIGNQVAAIERICAQNDKTTSAIEGPSRQVYCWLKFLCSEENLTLHLEALQRARDALVEHGLRPNHPVYVYLINMNSLWRKLQYRNAVVLKVNEGFLSAGHNVWQAIINTSLSHREPERDSLIREFTGSDDFSEVLFEIDSFAALTTLSAQGRAHNLDESFDRVNRAYFGSRMLKPRLVWNRTLTARKFGHYQSSRDTLMVSTSLDDPRVPAYVIDFIVYHELLHKKHGAMMVNGRRLVHSPSFRADEQQFVQYNEAEHYIKQLALKQRGSSGLITTTDTNDSDM